MAKIEKINLALDSESKRLLRNLTKALEKVARSMTPYEVKDGTRRLIEPAEDPEGSSEKVKPSEVEPALRFRTPDGRFVEDALREEVTKKLREWDSASPGISNVIPDT